MKKICVYFAVLLVFAAFGMTIFAHAGDLPKIPVSSNINNDLSEVGTEYELPISLPTSETELLLNKTQVQLIYRQSETLSTNNVAVTWSSSNNNVVKVDQGKLTAVGTGTATVTATPRDGGVPQSCTVTVRYAWWQLIIRIFFFGWLWY